MNDDDQNQSGPTQDGDIAGGSPEPTSEPANDIPMGTGTPPSSDEPPSEPTAEIPSPPPTVAGGEPEAGEPSS